MKGDKKVKGKVIVFYDNDPDGFGAAWAAWKKFGNQAFYFPEKHSMRSSALRNIDITDSIVYFLDFCPNPAPFESITKKAKQVVVIDHHGTVASVVKSTPGCIYSLRNSACILLWKYFHKNKKVPRILKHVEDVDLWKYRIPGTRELFVSLSWKFNFRHWNTIARIIENTGTRNRYIRKGRIIIGYQNELVARMSDEAERVRLGGHTAFAVNGSRYFNSLVGNHLLRLDKRIHVGIVFYFVDKNKYIRFSLRSDGKVDVGKIAHKLGGGGHERSAAFQWPSHKPLPFKTIKQKV